jgi:tetratricopeptide (TPR) repeat protein
MLTNFYQQFLETEDSARFIKDVAKNYMTGTLQRLYRGGNKLTRRAAILAIGFLGDFTLNETMGMALSDSDRAVRLLAEHNIRQIWQRQGSPMEQRLLSRLEAMNTCRRSRDALTLASRLLTDNQGLSEAWNQRAIAFSAVGDHENSISDCRQTLHCNRYHFPAAIGMGQGYLHLDDVFTALDCFRLALQINPDLEFLRGEVRRLERMLEEK